MKWIEAHMIHLFRRVVLPSDISGELFLHSMPPRYEAYSIFKTAISESQIDTLVCLAPSAEIQKKSPDYFHAIQSADVPCGRKTFEIRFQTLVFPKIASALFAWPKK